MGLPSSPEIFLIFQREPEMTAFHGTFSKTPYSFSPFHVPYTPSDSMSNFFSPCQFTLLRYGVYQSVKSLQTAKSLVKK